jgi:hypothetical protein
MRTTGKRRADTPLVLDAGAGYRRLSVLDPPPWMHGLRPLFRACSLVVVVLLFTMLADLGDQQAGPDAVEAATITKRIAVLLYNYPTWTKPPLTVDVARGKVFANQRSVRSYYLESSYGQLILNGKLNGANGDVFGSYMIPAATGCSYSSIISAVNTAAQAAGIDLSGYDHKLYIGVPQSMSCTIAGYTGSNFVDNAGMMSVGFTTHELGHVFGTWHSSAYRCYDSGGKVVAISASCTVTEYPGPGDPDVMGGTNDENKMKQLQAFHRGRLGWLAPSNTLTVTSSGTYTIAPIELQTTAVQVVRIPIGTTGKYYYLDFRQPGPIWDNYASSDPYVNGVAIRIAPDYSTRFDTLLIDTTPETLYFTDAPLTTGRSFEDAVAGISVTTINVGPNGAEVKVTLGSVVASPDVTAPTINISNPVAGAMLSGIASISIAALDNVGVTKVELYLDGVLLSTDTASPWSFAWDTTKTTNAAHALTARAYDAAGNENSSGSIGVTVQNAPPMLTETFTGQVGGKNGPATAIYNVTVTTSGPLNLDLSWSGNASLNVAVYNSTGALLTTNSATVTSASVTAGTYKIVVTAVSGQAKFTLKVSHY